MSFQYLVARSSLSNTYVDPYATVSSVFPPLDPPLQPLIAVAVSVRVAIANIALRMRMICSCWLWISSASRGAIRVIGGNEPLPHSHRYVVAASGPARRDLSRIERPLPGLKRYILVGSMRTETVDSTAGLWSA